MFPLRSVATAATPGTLGVLDTTPSRTASAAALSSLMRVSPFDRSARTRLPRVALPQRTTQPTDGGTPMQRRQNWLSRQTRQPRRMEAGCRMRRMRSTTLPRSISEATSRSWSRLTVELAAPRPPTVSRRVAGLSDEARRLVSHLGPDSDHVGPTDLARNGGPGASGTDQFVAVLRAEQPPPFRGAHPLPGGQVVLTPRSDWADPAGQWRGRGQDALRASAGIRSRRYDNRSSGAMTGTRIGA